jgi:hypothetical protein
MMWRYILAWAPMVVIAIVNGALRQQWYGHYLSELRAHQLSTLTGVLLFGLYIWALARLWRLESSAQALTIGCVWLALTVGFEFLVGHYVMRQPWSRLFHDYDIFAGRLWVVLLLWITVAPYVFYRGQT